MSSDIESILKRKLQKAVATLPKVLANDAVNHTLDAFRAQAWEDGPWPARAGGNTNRALLVKTGRMRRATRAENITGKGFVLVNDTPQAKAHNYGFSGTVSVPAHTRNKYKKTKQGTGKFTKKGKERTKTVRTVSGSVQVRAYSRKMNLPKRQFMGKSNALIQRLITKGKNHLLKSMNS